MKTALWMLLAVFVGFLLGWDESIYFYQWEFYAFMVPFSIMLVIYGRLGGNR